LLRLNATGICYSDVHFLLNDLASVPMSFFGVRSPGHEGAGVVVKTGANVKNFKVGDRAGVKPLMNVCGSCHLCWNGMENYCPNATHTGLMCTGEFGYLLFKRWVKTKRKKERINSISSRRQNTLHRYPTVWMITLPRPLCAVRLRWYALLRGLI
jgi:Zn-dependent alcohol dehydrogenase